MKKYILLIISIVSVWGCDKTDSQDITTQLRLSVTSTYFYPVKVYADIASVSVAVTDVDGTSDEQWLEVDNAKGVFNLYKLSNGAHQSLGAKKMSAGTITQIKITLGNNNYIVKANAEKPTQTDSIKIDFPKNFNPEVIIPLDVLMENSIITNLAVDFDMVRSLWVDADKTIYFAPKVRVYNYGYSSALRGSVTPADSVNFVAMIKEKDTVFTHPVTSGSFQVDGLSQGQWKIVINALPDTKYTDTTFTKQVDKSGVIQIDAVQLPLKKTKK